MSVERRSRGTGSYSYREKEGRWRGVLQHKYRSYQVYVRGPKNDKTERSIKAALKQLADRLEDGALVGIGRRTVEAFLEEWMEKVIEPHKRASTVKGYRSYIKHYWIPLIGRMQLRELTAQDVQVAINTMERSRKLKPRSIEQARAILRAALRRAEAWGYVRQNAAQPVTIPSVERGSGGEAFTPGEAWDFIDAIKGDEHEALYLVTIASGLRQGEILGLRWENVDLDAGTLTVEQTVQRLAGKSVIGPTKTKKSRRTIGLIPDAVTTLRSLHVRQTEQRLQAGRNWKKLGLIFTHADGSALIGSTVTHQFQRKLAGWGLRVIRFHDLRHSYASLLLEDGAELNEVKDALGHSQVSLTANTYAHPYPAQRKRTAARIDHALTRRDR